MKTLLSALALTLAGSASAATRTVEIGGQPGQPAIAVASACVENTSDYDIVLHSNWGIGDRDAAVFVAAGDEVLYRLVLDKATDATLALTYPADSTGAAGITAQLAAPWGTQRENDCAKLSRWALAGHTTDGSDKTVFTLTPMSQVP